MIVTRMQLVAHFGCQGGFWLYQNKTKKIETKENLFNKYRKNTMLREIHGTRFIFILFKNYANVLSMRRIWWNHIWQIAVETSKVKLCRRHTRSSHWNATTIRSTNTSYEFGEYEIHVNCINTCTFFLFAHLDLISPFRRHATINNLYSHSFGAQLVCFFSFVVYIWEWKIKPPTIAFECCFVCKLLPTIDVSIENHVEQTTVLMCRCISRVYDRTHTRINLWIVHSLSLGFIIALGALVVFLYLGFLYYFALCNILRVQKVHVVLVCENAHTAKGKCGHFLYIRVRFIFIW